MQLTFDNQNFFGRVLTLSSQNHVRKSIKDIFSPCRERETK